MATLSIDLRERILGAYDRKEGTRQQIADRFCVSLGMVKKLLQQRRNTGDIAPRHYLSGRKPALDADDLNRLKELVEDRPDLTLDEMRIGLGFDCSLPTIHLALTKMGFTYKKRRYVPVSRIEMT